MFERGGCLIMDLLCTVANVFRKNSIYELIDSLPQC